MYVLVETDPSTKKSESFTFTNFEELHTWVTTRLPAPSESIDKKQSLIKSFLTYFGINNDNSINTTDSACSNAENGDGDDENEVENKDEDEDDTHKEAYAKVVADVADITKVPSTLPLQWNISSTAPIARLDFESSAGTLYDSRSVFTDELNNFFDVAKNTPTSLQPITKVSEYIRNGYNNQIESILIDTNRSRYSEQEYYNKKIDANIALNDFSKWFIKKFSVESKDCIYNFSKHEFYTLDEINTKYIDCYSESSFKFCALLAALFGKSFFTKSSNCFFNFDNDETMPDNFKQIFDILSPMRIYDKLIMSIKSPYHTIEWCNSFIPYFKILRALRFNEPKRYDGQWETLAFKLSIRYAIEKFNLLAVKELNNNLYGDYMSDVVEAFMSMRLNENETGSVKSSELYAAFNKFIEDVFINDDSDVADMCRLVITPYMNSKMFANELKSKGIQSVRKSAGIFYTGIDMNKSGLVENNKKEELNIEKYDIKDIGSWKAIYGSGECLTLGDNNDKYAPIDLKLVPSKPVAVNAPKLVTLRSEPPINIVLS
jgi:hypothetical protein